MLFPALGYYRLLQRTAVLLGQTIRLVVVLAVVGWDRVESLHATPDTPGKVAMDIFLNQGKYGGHEISVIYKTQQKFCFVCDRKY